MIINRSKTKQEREKENKISFRIKSLLPPSLFLDYPLASTALGWGMISLFLENQMFLCL